MVGVVWTFKMEISFRNFGGTWRAPPLHINKKELIAAINTIKSLSKEGETVSLSVDNQVIYYYLTKGGEGKPLQCNASTFIQMVNGKKHNFTSKLGAFKRMFGRSNLQVGDGQGGLNPGPPFV